MTNHDNFCKCSSCLYEMKISPSRKKVRFRRAKFFEPSYVYAPYIPLQVTPTIFSPEEITVKTKVTSYAKDILSTARYIIKAE